MTINPCDKLDDYLGGELSASIRGTFESHLTECEACRRAVELDAQMHQWLAAAPLEAAPELTARIDRRLRRARLVQYGTRTALLAASIATVSLGIWSARKGEKVIADVPLPANPPIANSVHIAFAPEQKVIAMPLKSTNPNVSIVWVYPTVEANSDKLNEPAEEFN